jgi:hypothetical protein
MQALASDMSAKELDAAIDINNRLMFGILGVEEFDRIVSLLTPRITYADVIPGAIRDYPDPNYRR